MMKTSTVIDCARCHRSTLKTKSYYCCNKSAYYCTLCQNSKCLMCSKPRTKIHQQQSKDIYREKQPIPKPVQIRGRCDMCKRRDFDFNYEFFEEKNCGFQFCFTCIYDRYEEYLKVATHLKQKEGVSPELPIELNCKCDYKQEQITNYLRKFCAHCGKKMEGSYYDLKNKLRLMSSCYRTIRVRGDSMIATQKQQSLLRIINSLLIRCDSCEHVIDNAGRTIGSSIDGVVVCNLCFRAMQLSESMFNSLKIQKQEYRAQQSKRKKRNYCIVCNIELENETALNENQLCRSCKGKMEQMEKDKLKDKKINANDNQICLNCKNNLSREEILNKSKNCDFCKAQNRHQDFDNNNQKEKLAEKAIIYLEKKQEPRIQSLQREKYSPSSSKQQNFSSNNNNQIKLNGENIKLPKNNINNQKRQDKIEQRFPIKQGFQKDMKLSEGQKKYYQPQNRGKDLSKDCKQLQFQELQIYELRIKQQHYQSDTFCCRCSEYLPQQNLFVAYEKLSGDDKSLRVTEQEQAAIYIKEEKAKYYCRLCYIFIKQQIIEEDKKAKRKQQLEYYRGGYRSAPKKEKPIETNPTLNYKNHYSRIANFDLTGSYKQPTHLEILKKVPIKQHLTNQQIFPRKKQSPFRCKFCSLSIPLDDFNISTNSCKNCELKQKKESLATQFCKRCRNHVPSKQFNTVLSICKNCDAMQIERDLKRPKQQKTITFKCKKCTKTVQLKLSQVGKYQLCNQCSKTILS